MSQTTVEPVAARVRPLSLDGVSELSTRDIIPRAPGPRGEHRAGGAEGNNENNTEGARQNAQVPGLTQANLKRLEDKDPLVAALASEVSSLPPSETTPIPPLEKIAKVANAKVKAWTTAARKGKGKDAALGPMFGATWGDDTFQIPYGDCDASASAHSLQWKPNWVSKQPMPSKEPKEPQYMEREPSPRAVAPEPSCVERGLPPRRGAPKLRLDETTELLSRVPGCR